MHFEPVDLTYRRDRSAFECESKDIYAGGFERVIYCFKGIYQALYQVALATFSLSIAYLDAVPDMQLSAGMRNASCKNCN